jgi:calreticulin
MFGPDLCGYDVSRIHLIFRDHEDKNLVRKEDIKLSYEEKNEFTHMYTLIMKPDRSYTVLFDYKVKATGQLADDWDFLASHRDDHTDVKPSDWVDEEEIYDPAARYSLFGRILHSRM